VFLFRAELAKLPGRKNKEALSNKRINGIVGVLRQILNEAADRFGFVSPVSSLTPGMSAAPTSCRSPWTRFIGCWPRSVPITATTSSCAASPACAPARSTD
jgi:hypothetical protein